MSVEYHVLKYEKKYDNINDIPTCTMTAEILEVHNGKPEKVYFVPVDGVHIRKQSNQEGEQDE